MTSPVLSMATHKRVVGQAIPVSASPESAEAGTTLHRGRLASGSVETTKPPVGSSATHNERDGQDRPTSDACVILTLLLQASSPEATAGELTTSAVTRIEATSPN